MKQQRFIKFRAWVENNMEYNVIVGKIGAFYAYIDPRDTASAVTIKYENDVPIMQYTGLSDRNGKEIYEGDIVKYTYIRFIPQNGTANMIVSFYQGEFIIATVNGEPLTLREAIKISNNAKIGIEIIGNIYENPSIRTL